MKSITTQAIFTGFSSKVDRSLSFRGTTPELTSREKAVFMEYQNLNVRLLIEPIDFPVEGKDEIKSELDTKTPSQRLRAVLFVWWKQRADQGQNNGTFDQFYTARMESFISEIKAKLEPES